MAGPDDRQRRVSRRALLLGTAKLGLFGVLAGRLYQLQVVEADRYATLADDNRISVRFAPAPRGLVLDRFGRPFAHNRQTYRLSVVPESAGDLRTTLDRLATVVPVPDGERERVFEAVGRQRGFVPIVVLANLSWQEMARISAHLPTLPGVQIEETQLRVYPHGPTAAHVVGYVGPVSEEELTGDPVLSLPDFRIGKAGVERVHDLHLRGTADRYEVEVNALGRVIRELSRDEGVPGGTLMLTLDAELQNFTANRFGDQTGGAAVMDVHTGEILAMTSSPSYDPNPFDLGVDEDAWRRLIADRDAPLTNKCVSGQYAPGSTFKMVVAAAALEYGVVPPDQSFFCNGVHELGRGRFHCWRRGGHGWMNMHDAIVQSCDVYFYEVARRIGIDRIAEMAARFGLGEKLGVDLPNERPGLMPTREWKQGRLGEAWMVGETLVAGIGQGYVLTTPLQLAVMTARLVNGGRAVRPRITRALDTDEVESPEFPPIGVGRRTFELMARAMEGVTESRRGTGYGARIPVEEFRMAGKTGTSQVRRITMQERRAGNYGNEHRPREERDHALFVGYAPLDRPRYACAVIVEHGGSGSRAAAPIARDVLLETQRRDPSGRAPHPREVVDARSRRGRG